MSIRKILLLSHLKIHNANALSSSLTIGFPAMTAWLGAAHALQRKLNQSRFKSIVFTGIGVVCHKMDLQTYKGERDFVHSIIGTANPLDKTGKRSSFIEEARCHLDVSLTIACEGFNPLEETALLEAINIHLNTSMKFAGGDLLRFKQPEIMTVDDHLSFKRLIRQLMPGYVLVSRHNLMLDAMQDGQDALAALLDFLGVKHRSHLDDEGEVNWTSTKRHSGWLVPVAVGFQGISPLQEAGETENQRDDKYPHRFAESMITLGEFVMPHRIKVVDGLFWSYQVDKEKNFYLCRQNSGS